MALTTDFHMHSSYSGDSDTPMEQMASQALKAGLTQICFTEHMDYDYPTNEEIPEGYFEFNTIGQYSSDDLSNGDIAIFSGSCVNDQYIQLADGELGIAPLPRAIGNNSFYTGWNRGPIFLMQSEEVNRGAYEFIKFFLKPENNSKWAQMNSALSPYGTTQKEESYKNYINNIPEGKALPCVQANLDISGSFPNVTGSAAVRRYLEEYLNNVVDGQISAEEAVKKLEIDCNNALAGK